MVRTGSCSPTTLSKVQAVIENRWILLRECFEKLKFTEREGYISVDIDWRKKINHFNMLSGSFHTVENETSEPAVEETSAR